MRLSSSRISFFEPRDRALLPQRTPRDLIRSVIGVLGVVFLVSACAPPPSLRVIDAVTASQNEIDIGVEQMNAVAANRLHIYRENRLASAGSLLAGGILISVLLVGQDPCRSSIFSDEDCFGPIVGLAATGAFIGTGVASLLITPDRELELEALVGVTPENGTQSRTKLDMLYTMLEGEPEVFSDAGAMHTIASGSLIGIGAMFMLWPSVLEDDSDTGDDFLLPGIITATVGVAYAVTVAILQDADVPDLNMGVVPQVSRDGAGVSFLTTF